MIWNFDIKPTDGAIIFASMPILNHETKLTKFLYSVLRYNLAFVDRVSLFLCLQKRIEKPNGMEGIMVGRPATNMQII